MLRELRDNMIGIDVTWLVIDKISWAFISSYQKLYNFVIAFNIIYISLTIMLIFIFLIICMQATSHYFDQYWPRYLYMYHQDTEWEMKSLILC